MPRLNPRQRWEEDRSSNVAGVPMEVWFALHGLAGTQFVSQDLPADPAARQYRSELASFMGALIRATIRIVAGDTDWVDEGVLKARGGRGTEITVVSKDYGVMRSFLTNASLGWYDQAKEVRSRQVKAVLEMLDKSSDRRENTWDYRDKKVSDLNKYELASRMKQIRSDIKFRQGMDKIFERMRDKDANAHQGLADALDLTLITAEDCD